MYHNLGTDTDINAMMQLALGRILRLGSRPTQPGDVEAYERCRHLFLDGLAHLGITSTDPQPIYARDYKKGADF